MSWLPVYLDSSAILKLVVPEPESAALEAELGRWSDWVSSHLAAVECRRALKRIQARATLRTRADQVLASIVLVRIDEPVLRLAESIGPRTLRTLDAIHLATAISLGDHPEAFYTYDARQADAARRLGLVVRQPS